MLNRNSSKEWILHSEKRICEFFSRHPVAVIITRKSATSDMLEIASYYEVPLLITKSRTSEFMAALIASLNVYLAPRITIHGVLVEAYGKVF